MNSIRFPLIVAAALAASGCGSNKPPEQPAASTTAPAAPAPAKPVEYFHVDSATAGAIHGRIIFKGALPAKKVISMDSEAGCSSAHAGHPVYDEAVLTGKNSSLVNAFVYIQTGLEGKTFEPPKDPVTLDQHGCLFVPRVFGIRAGQPLDLKNNDTVSHNVHPMPKENREWNEQQSPGAPDVEHKFPRPEIMIPVKCNIHNWMHAYIGVMQHPYFAATGTDGSFEWKDVPPGDYTIAVWHEKLGDQTKQIHLDPSGQVTADFTYR